jgi:predicted DNA-binding protein
VSTTTIRISRRAQREARALAQATGKPMSQVVEDAIQAERRRVFWSQFRAAAARVAEDPQASAEESAETAFFEGTLSDGLEGEAIPE